MSLQFKIENNVAIPNNKGNKKYPFAEMKVGDSFTIDPSTISTVRAAASYFGIRNSVKFSIRRLPHECRVWRIA